MAESSWPSPSDGRTVDDIEHEKIGIGFGPYAGVIGDFTSPQLIYGDSSGRQFKVAADRYALVRGHIWWSGSSIVTVPIAANTSGSTRVDLVVLRLSRTTWDVNLTVIQGTPGAGNPSSTQNNGTTGVWDLQLAYVTVANNASTISAANVQYIGPHLDPGGGRVRIPAASWPWATSPWAVALGTEFLDATGLVVRWNGSNYDTIYKYRRVATATRNTDSSTWTGTESGSLLSVTASLINGQLYRVSMCTWLSTDATTYPINLQSAVETSVVRVKEDSAAGTSILGPQIPLPTTSTTGFYIGSFADFTAAATGSKQFHLTGQRIGGSGNHQIRAGAGRITTLTVDHAVPL